MFKMGCGFLPPLVVGLLAVLVCSRVESVQFERKGNGYIVPISTISSVKLLQDQSKFESNPVDQYLYYLQVSYAAYCSSANLSAW